MMKSSTAIRLSCTEFCVASWAYRRPKPRSPFFSALFGRWSPVQCGWAQPERSRDNEFSTNCKHGSQTLWKGTGRGHPALLVTPFRWLTWCRTPTTSYSPECSTPDTKQDTLRRKPKKMLHRGCVAGSFIRHKKCMRRGCLGPHSKPALMSREPPTASTLNMHGEVAMATQMPDQLCTSIVTLDKMRCNFRGKQNL